MANGVIPVTAVDPLARRGAVPLRYIDDMASTSMSDLAAALTQHNSEIPIGICILRVGGNGVGNRAAVLCSKINANLGRGYVISAYAINGGTVTLGANGTWSAS